MLLKKVHHIAIICSNYKKSKAFYTEILGLEILQESYRKDRDSYKLDLSLNGAYIIELFSFPSSPKRVNKPEATGLRHLAFAVGDIQTSVDMLNQKGIETEAIRIDELTGKKYTFFFDPDNLPIELYEE